MCATGLKRHQPLGSTPVPDPVCEPDTPTPPSPASSPAPLTSTIPIYTLALNLSVPKHTHPHPHTHSPSPFCTHVQRAPLPTAPAGIRRGGQETLSWRFRTVSSPLPDLQNPISAASGEMNGNLSFFSSLSVIEHPQLQRCLHPKPLRARAPGWPHTCSSGALTPGVRGATGAVPALQRHRTGGPFLLRVAPGRRGRGLT